MATLSVFWYGRGVQALDDGSVDWLANTIKVALLDAAHIIDQGADRYFSDVAADEVVGDGYTAGGQVLGSKTLAYDPATRRTVLGGANIVWDPSTIAAQYAVLYKDTGDPATSPLVGYGDAGSEQTSDGAAFNITWHADGILRTTAVAQA